MSSLRKAHTMFKPSRTSMGFKTHFPLQPHYGVKRARQKMTGLLLEKGIKSVGVVPTTGMCGLIQFIDWKRPVEQINVKLGKQENRRSELLRYRFWKKIPKLCWLLSQLPSFCTFLTHQRLENSEMSINLSLYMRLHGEICGFQYLRYCRVIITYCPALD